MSAASVVLAASAIAVAVVSAWYGTASALACGASDTAPASAFKGLLAGIVDSCSQPNAGNSCGLARRGKVRQPQWAREGGIGKVTGAANWPQTN